MKIALITDCHFGARQSNPIFLENQRKFFQNIFFPKLEEENIDTVFDLGDTFDNRKIVNFDVLYKTREFFFDEMQRRNIKYHAIVGNHTVTYRNTNKVNAMDLLLTGYENFHLYTNEPVELKFDNTKFIMVPWLTTDNSEKSLDTVSKSTADVVCGHFDISGFEMMRGIKSEHGLDRKFFSKFYAVYSGHYHHPSQSGNIEYLGAPYEMNWSDAGCKRGFHIFDCETKKKRFIENPYKMHITLDFDDAQMTKSDIDDLNVDILSGAFVKINVRGSKKPHLLESLIEKMGNASSVIVTENKDELKVSNFDLQENKGISDLIDDYLVALKTDADIDEKVMEKVKVKIKSLYSTAITMVDE